MKPALFAAVSHINELTFYRLARLMSLLLFVVAAAINTACADEPLQTTLQKNQHWRFRVFLDQKEIGYHNFYLEQQGATHVMRTAAEFEYKLLFVKLYEYQHENQEVWQGDCLKSIESSTDANGKPFRVMGQREQEAFVVQGKNGEATLPPCIMSFAYWNPVFLRQTQLLNSQDGEYLDVLVSTPVQEQLIIQGNSRPAIRYHLEAGTLSLDLWYSEDSEWLGLQSETTGGRTLRYELL